MTKTQLREALGVSRARLDEWIAAGLPHEGTKRRPRFDADAVADWLIEQGHYRRPAGVVDSIGKVAAHFGVSARMVGYWKDQGMPWSPPDRYDLERIAAWRRAQRGAAETDKQTTRGHWETESKRLEAQRRQLQLDHLRGRLIAVDAVVAIFRAHIAEAKTHLEQLPDWVLSIVDPQRERKAELRRQLDGRVRDILQALADSIDELTADESGENRDEH